MTRVPTSAWPGRALALLAMLAALWAVMVIHATGQTLLALTLLVISGMAVWTYTSTRTVALRYLFPGVAAALVFVVFPMLYTMGIAFTNHSSRNLLDLDRARAQLMEEAVIAPDSQRRFTLEALGSRLRVRLAPTGAGADAAVTPPIVLLATPQTIALEPATSAPEPGLPLSAVVQHLPTLRLLQLKDGSGQLLSLTGLHEFALQQPLYLARADGALTDRLSGKVYHPDMAQGFFTADDGDRLQPGFRVNVGLSHFAQVFSQGKFREPFLSVFVWTVVFSALSVVGAASLGLLLAGLLHWPALPGRSAYRLVLFLPYAVPGFISILVFKGLFNQNLGEVNLILNALFGIRPAWFSDPLLAKLMLLIVNIWLGFPYMMVLCSGLIQSIPSDLYEASAVVGAGPWTNFTRITLPLILKPLTPLLISAFAFNFNNFVLVSLLTGGRPDQADSTLPAGTTDILVSYTWRIAFQDSGQQFGLAAAISTVIFGIVAAITLIQLRLTSRAEASKKG
ncbi:MAG: maltose ABC transporter permease MalF [Ideonella sp.]|nr:maltose ABC transporter permease MalF [Ideonella sp.]